MTFRYDGPVMRLSYISIAVALTHSAAIAALDDVYWSPSDITTTVWYDAADSNTITYSTVNGTNFVSQWNDKSGNTNNASQGNMGSQPRTDLRTINGLNALDWDAVGFGQDQLQLSSDIAGQPPFFAFIVAHPDNTSGGNNVINQRNGTDSALGNGGNIVAKWASGSPGGINFSGGSGIGTNAGIMEFWIDSSSNAYVSINGSLSPTSAGTWSSATNYAFGRLGRNGSDTLDGKLGEVIIMQYELSDADRQKVEGYLAWKFEIEIELPEDHPYKDAPPGKPPTGTLITLF